MDDDQTFTGCKNLLANVIAWASEKINSLTQQMQISTQKEFFNACKCGYIGTVVYLLDETDFLFILGLDNR